MHYHGQPVPPPLPPLPPAPPPLPPRCWFAPRSARSAPSPTIPSPATLPPATPPPAPSCGRRAGSAPSAGYAVLATLGAGVAGLASHYQNPDVLTTGIAAGITFVGAFLGLHLLHWVGRLVWGAARIAAPVALVLAIGCALDCRWAERTVRWLHAAGERGLSLAHQAFAGN